MSRYKIISIFFIALCFIVSGCSKKNINSNENKDESIGSLPSIKSEELSDMTETTEEQLSDITETTEEEYKELLMRNYEKYIKPLDLDSYDDLKETLESKGVIENGEFVAEYKANINDNRTNLKSFEQSMANIDLEDLKIKEINDKLVKECKKYINDLDKRESYLQDLDENILTKSSNEFIDYLEEFLDKGELDNSQFEEIVTETQNSLNIQLKDEKEIE